MATIRKVGGIHFIKAGRVNISFSLSRAKAKPSTHDLADDIVTRIEDAIATPLNPVMTIGALVIFILWTLTLVQVDIDSWVRIGTFLLTPY